MCSNFFFSSKRYTLVCIFVVKQILFPIWRKYWKFYNLFATNHAPYEQSIYMLGQKRKTKNNNNSQKALCLYRWELYIDNNRKVKSGTWLLFFISPQNKHGQRERKRKKIHEMPTSYRKANSNFSPFLFFFLKKAVFLVLFRLWFCFVNNG